MDSVIAADEESALALMDGLQQLWAASGITEIRATPPTPPPASGVRVHAGIRRTDPGSQASLPQDEEQPVATADQ
ncbi:hypothetical protein ACIQVA_38340 [Streptomyces microflavus]|uniref:hypothetical protein n=1 Tax=Streptomyces microflavus TaxID=1919 RepID=UPI00381926A6